MYVIFFSEVTCLQFFISRCNISPAFVSVTQPTTQTVIKVYGSVYNNDNS